MHENFGEARTAVLAGPGKRDLRLDLLRGIGQWMVFLDHIPYNFLNWFTLRNYGFSDAAEIFVFISGHSIGFSCGPAVKADQFLAVSAQQLGDETFMSATELRDYLMQAEMAKASKSAGSDTAEKAREELIRSLMGPVLVTAGGRD